MRDVELAHDLGHDAGADRLAALAEGEARALLERNVVDKVADKLNVVTGHDHGLLGVLRTRRVRQRDGHVGRADEHLRTVLLLDHRNVRCS